jgi:UPF0176 protein
MATASLPRHLKDEPVVTFCTGGIRCEKAALFLQKTGFTQVFQLDGGILRYFEECGGEHFEGDCFVFDKRVALDASLRETGAALCFVCQTPLTVFEQEDPRYIESISCRIVTRAPTQASSSSSSSVVRPVMRGSSLSMAASIAARFLS